MEPCYKKIKNSCCDFEIKYWKGSLVAQRTVDMIILSIHLNVSIYVLGSCRFQFCVFKNQFSSQTSKGSFSPIFMA